MDDWQAKADWMRKVVATSATWSGDVLTSLTLGPAPVDDAEDTTPARPLSHRTPAEIKRIALGASGGPVRKLT